MSRRNTGGRVRAVFFLLVSFAAAAVACVMIYLVLSSYRQRLIEAEQKEETVLVMVAARDLYQGVTIVEEDLTMNQLPPTYVPPSVLREREQAIGRVPRERILRSEFIREERLADSEAGLGLNAIIPRGMRALSINITDGSAVSGFLNPGNYVDILVTLKGDDEQGLAPETITMLQAVPVLAVNSRVGQTNVTAENYRPSITVAVTPEQAEKLTHAVAQGEVTLTLRNDIDVTHVETHGAEVKALLGGETDEKRITVKEWKAIQAENKDGTLLIIQGSNTTIEKRPN
jgi:pilus assembly protein CpaB